MSYIFSQKKEGRYITLKEAAQMSGYSSDYVGQLIRAGKISGKRVYANPVWMTTEKDLMEYLEANNGTRVNKSKGQGRLATTFRFWKTKIRSEMELMKLYKGILYFIIFISLIFSLFMFYIFSVNFDAWLSERSTGESAVPLPEEDVLTPEEGLYF
ncbi:MAG: helix-turn-helix domain-containing protein [Candidatus Paceibacterota bacterium]